MKTTFENTGITINQPRWQALPNFIANTPIYVLRLDNIHPVINGNKWYKLQYYFQEALSRKSTGILTYGGIWSNHLIAAAAAAANSGLRSIGVVNAHVLENLTPTLKSCMQYGMELTFLPRKQWPYKKVPFNYYEIPEGGDGALGRKGASQIADYVPLDCTHLCLSVGTGTTFLGLHDVLPKTTNLLGFAPFKDGIFLQKEWEIKGLLKHPVQLFDHWHFGGFGKITSELVDFMNQFYRQFKVPLDRVYTGKMFFAIRELAARNYFPNNAKIYCIHTGGLQGNSSLPAIDK